MNELLIPEITALLAKCETKATFKALGGMLNTHEAWVMNPFARTMNNRWIVNTKTGVATGYPAELLDADYCKIPIQLEKKTTCLLSYLSKEKQVKYQKNSETF